MGIKTSEELTVLPERPMKHQLLSTVMLIIRAIRIRRAEWPNCDDNCLLSEGWFITDTLGHGVVLHKMQECGVDGRPM